MAKIDRANTWIGAVGGAIAGIGGLIYLGSAVSTWLQPELNVTYQYVDEAVPPTFTSVADHKSILIRTLDKELKENTDSFDRKALQELKSKISRLENHLLPSTGLMFVEIENTTNKVLQDLRLEVGITDVLLFELSGSGFTAEELASLEKKTRKGEHDRVENFSIPTMPPRSKLTYRIYGQATLFSEVDIKGSDIRSEVRDRIPIRNSFWLSLFRNMSFFAIPIILSVGFVSAVTFAYLSSRRIATSSKPPSPLGESNLLPQSTPPSNDSDSQAKS